MMIIASVSVVVSGPGAPPVHMSHQGHYERSRTFQAAGFGTAFSSANGTENQLGKLVFKEERITGVSVP